MLRSFADESIRGQSHESRGTECQDSCDAYVDPHQGFAIAVVSDGHGGRKYTLLAVVLRGNNYKQEWD